MKKSNKFRVNVRLSNKLFKVYYCDSFEEAVRLESQLSGERVEEQASLYYGHSKLDLGYHISIVQV